MIEKTRLIGPLFLLIIILLISNNSQITYGQEQADNNQTDQTLDYSSSLSEVDSQGIMDVSSLSRESLPPNNDLPVQQQQQLLKPKVIIQVDEKSSEVGTPLSIKIVKENPPLDSSVTIKWGDTKEETIPNTENKGLSVEHVYDDTGEYTIYATFIKCDPDNPCISDSESVEVQSPPPVPQPSITIDNIDPDEPVADEVMSINGTIANPPSNSFTVDWGDDTKPEEQTVPSGGSAGDKWNIQHIYDKSGSYTIKAALDGCNNLDNSAIQSCSTTKGVNVIDESNPSISIDKTDPNSPLTNNKLSIIGSTRHAPSDHINIDWGDDTNHNVIVLRDKGNWVAEHRYSTLGGHTITATLDGCPSFLECKDTKNIVVSEVSNPGNFFSDPTYRVVSPTSTHFPISIPLILIIVVVSISGIVIAHKLWKRGQKEKSGYQPTVEVRTKVGIED
jgi:hypothetical protein